MTLGPYSEARARTTFDATFDLTKSHLAASAAIQRYIDEQVRAHFDQREAEVLAVLYFVSWATGVPVFEIIEARRAEVACAYRVRFFEDGEIEPLFESHRFSTLDAAERSARKDLQLVPGGRAEIRRSDDGGPWRVVGVLRRCGKECRGD